MFSNTFAGIAPSSTLTFVAAQVVGGVLAVVIKTLYPKLTPADAGDVVVPHSDVHSQFGHGGTGAHRALDAEGAGCRVEGDRVSDRPVVLFLCVHNAGRSLAARVLLEHYAGGRVDVLSVGSEPFDQLNPSVVAILQQRGLDPRHEFPKPLTGGTARVADVIVTMGCGDTCPVYPGKRYLDWELDDPAGQSIEDVRPIIDEIDRRVHVLLAELVGPTSS
jgi:arsenate reductase